MASAVLTEMTASLSALKQNPIATVASGQGAAVALLNQNKPVFYCLPAATYAALLEQLEDSDLNAIADERLDDPLVMIGLEEL